MNHPNPYGHHPFHNHQGPPGLPPPPPGLILKGPPGMPPPYGFMKGPPPPPPYGFQPPPYNFPPPPPQQQHTNSPPSPYSFQPPPPPQHTNGPPSPYNFQQHPQQPPNNKFINQLSPQQPILPPQPIINDNKINDTIIPATTISPINTTNLNTSTSSSSISTTNIVSSSSSSSSSSIIANKDNTASTNTTAYIGKIPTLLEDSFIKSLLDQCGKVINWKRASETNGKLKAFGFCTFEHAEGAIKALKILNDLQVDGEGGKLIVKVDNTQKFYSDYLEKQVNIMSNDSPEEEELRDKIKYQIEKNLPNIQDKKKNITNEINDFYNKDRRELTKEEKIKIIEREKEKEKQRYRDREIKNKERDMKDFKEKERAWERREKNKEFDREDERDKERDKERRELQFRIKEMEEYSDSDEKQRKRVRSRDSIKYRIKEREDDEKDLIKEQNEIKMEQEQQLLLLKKQKEDEQVNKIQINNTPTSLQQSTSSTATGNKKIKLVNKGFDSIEDQDDNQSDSLNQSSSSSISSQTSHQAIKKKYSNLLNYNEIDSILNPKQQPQQQEETLKSTMDLQLQNIASEIPTSVDELFKLKVSNWNSMDKQIDEKMKPWITQKVLSFFGTKEDEFIDFIVNLLKSRTDPVNIVLKLKDVFEDNAQDFVLKMWRMILFLDKI